MKRAILIFLFGILFFQTAAASDPKKGGKTKLWEIPYEVSPQKFMVVNIQIGDSFYRFIFDTGTTVTAISETLAASLGLNVANTIGVNDTNKTRLEMGLTYIPALEISGIEVKNMETIILPDSNFLIKCLGFDGIIGSGFLRKYCVKIDAQQQKLIASKGNPWKHRGERWVKLKHWKGAHPHLDVTFENGFGNKQEAWALFDTGNVTETIHLPSKCFTEKTIVDEITDSFGSNSMGIHGAGEYRDLYRGRVSKLKLGLSAIDSITVTSGVRYNIGVKILEYGDVILDFPRSRYLFIQHTGKSTWITEPQSLFRVVFAGGKAFFSIVWDKELSAVISPGDRLLRIDDHLLENIDDCTMFAWRSFLEGLSISAESTVTILAQDGTQHIFSAGSIFPAIVHAQ